MGLIPSVAAFIGAKFYYDETTPLNGIHLLSDVTIYINFAL